MKNTPSALKWLAEKRARIAFDLQTKKQIIERLEKQVADLEVDLAALDRSITIYDSRIDPQGIEPINGWKGTYGKRGALKDAVGAFIREVAPHVISTSDLEVKVCLEFGIAFATQEERSRWRKGGFFSALKILNKEGLIERDDSHFEKTGQFGHWRWRGHDHSLKALERTVAMKAASSASPPAS